MQTFDNLFDAILPQRRLIYHENKTSPKEKTIIKKMEMVIDTLSTCDNLSMTQQFSMYEVMKDAVDYRSLLPTIRLMP